MKTDLGMLWYDDDAKRSLEQKVERAVAFYAEKYGAAANICFVHPSALAEPAWVGSVHVVPLRTVLVNHLWVGVADGAALPSREPAA